MFSKARRDMKNNKGTGRPVRMKTDKNVKKVRTLVKASES
jgi:hypothetical protein